MIKLDDRVDERFVEDDDDASLSTLHRALSLGGHAVARSADATQFVALIEEAPELPCDKRALAESFVDGLARGSSLARRELIARWPALLPGSEAFLAALASRCEAPGLDRALLRIAETLVLTESPLARSCTLKLTVGVPLGRDALLHGVRPDGSPDTLLCKVSLPSSRRASWTFPVPILGNLSGAELRQSLAREAWRRIESRALLGHASRRLAGRVARAHALATRAVRRVSRSRLALPSLPSPTHVPLGSRAAQIISDEQARADAFALPAACAQPLRAFASEPGVGEGSTESWDRFFERENPWLYESPYEQEKYERTLSLLPENKLARALELACAEGHFTKQLAPRVHELRATDISRKALERTQRRCEGLSNVRYDVLDLYAEPLGGPYDLVVCSEVLYYMDDEQHLQRLIAKLARAIVPGGLFVHAHAFDVCDDASSTGFDWGVSFAAKKISECLGASSAFQREVTLRTELYVVERYRRVESASLSTRVAPPKAPQLFELPLTPRLEPSVAGSVVWNGAIKTRVDAEDEERTYDLPVLMYHRIADDGPDSLASWRVSPSAFEHQLRFLKRRGYRSIDIDEWDEAAERSASIRGRPILLTFDDAYADFYETAWPILERNGFSAHVFVVAEKVGQTSSWDARHGAPFPLMTWEQIAELAGRGITFGSHLSTHTSADCLSSEQLLREAAFSRALLARAVGRDVDTVAAPYGTTDARIEQVCAAAGFRRLFADGGGPAPISGLRMRTPRIDILGEDDIYQFAEKLLTPEPPDAGDLPTRCTTSAARNDH